MAGKKIALNEKQIIRAAMATSGTTIKAAAETIEVKANAIANQLGRADSTMTLTSVYALLNAMGFEIVVRDKDGKRGGVEYVLGENRDDIESKQYMPEIEQIKAENAAAMKSTLK